MNIIKEPWKDFDGKPTEAISINTNHLYTISEFITLLEEAKKLWGDKEILIHDLNTDSIGGFSVLYLHHGYDIDDPNGGKFHQDDIICISG